MSLKHTYTNVLRAPKQKQRDSIFIIEMMAGLETAVDGMRSEEETA